MANDLTAAIEYLEAIARRWNPELAESGAKLFIGISHGDEFKLLTPDGERFRTLKELAGGDEGNVMKLIESVFPGQLGTGQKMLVQSLIGMVAK